MRFHRDPFGRLPIEAGERHPFQFGRSQCLPLRRIGRPLGFLARWLSFFGHWGLRAARAGRQENYMALAGAASNCVRRSVWRSTMAAVSNSTAPA